jgi:arylsulfatase A-like enzyme
MGDPAAVTPHADRLARRGVSFRRAFCQATECVPSRCSFLTGWYPHVRGHRSMSMLLRPDDPVLVRRLKDAGYHTWWGGGRGTDAADFAFGTVAFCDVRFDGKDKANLDLVRETLPRDTSNYVGATLEAQERALPDWHAVEAAVEQVREAPPDRPFFLQLDLGAPHPPYRVGRKYRDLIDTSLVPPRTPTPESWQGLPARYRLTHETNAALRDWTEEQWQELRATYYGMCSRVDEQLGMVLDALEEAGHDENTAVFFFADHGDFAGDYGMVDKFENTFPDGTLRVPLIIKLPSCRAVQPRISGAMVELVDLSATIEQLAGLEPECTTFGRSLLDVVAGNTDTHREYVFAEGGGTHAERDCRLLGTGGERKYHPDSNSYPKMVAYTRRGPEYGKAIMIRGERYKYVRRLYETDELYDLETDPGELHNRVDDPALANVLTTMQDRLLEFYLETSDVLMRGRGNSGAWPPADPAIRPGAGMPE